MDLILSRRSIRKYTDEQVSDNIIKDLIRAAVSAPSAGNQQPWHFIVIRDRSILDEIPKFHQYAQMLKGVGVAILVCADPSVEKFKDRWPLDCAAATQNILLAANSKGLGSVWVGLYPEEARMKDIRNLMGIPEDIMPVALIPIGYPAEEKPAAERYDENRVHYDKW